MYLIKYALTSGVKMVQSETDENTLQKGDLIKVSGYPSRYIYGIEIVSGEYEAEKLVDEMLRRARMGARKKLMKLDVLTGKDLIQPHGSAPAVSE